MNYRFFYKIILSLAIFCVPVISFAFYQSTNGKLEAVVSPDNPGAEQTVSILLKSYFYNLDGCLFTWTVDDIEITKGTGQKTFSFKTAPIGKANAVSAIINCPGIAETITKNFVFQSNDIDFLISADTYTPSFYRGGTQPTANSGAKIVALPQVYDNTGNLIPATELIYRWFKNGKLMTNSSGFNKSVLNVRPIDSEGLDNIKLEISSLAGEVKVVKNVPLTLTAPKVLFYETKPLSGVQYQNSLSGDLDLKQEEISLIAEPFFFNNTDLANNLIKFNWTMNKQDFTANSNGGQITTLRQEQGVVGTATVGIRVSSVNNKTSAENILRMSFGQRNLIFGL